MGSGPEVRDGWAACSRRNRSRIRRGGWRGHCGPGGLAADQALHLQCKQLSELVNGRSGISPEMAIRLDKAFGGGAETWYRLQAAYDLAQAMKNASRIQVERVPIPV